MPRTATHRIIDIDVTKELEVSWVPKGSNDKAKVFLKKAADQPEQRTTEMKLSLLKSVAIAALMANPTTAAFTESFAKEEELDAFLAKDEVARDTEIAAFAKAKNMPWDPKNPDAKPAVKKEEIEGDPAGNEVFDITTPEGLQKAIAKAIASDPGVTALREENAGLKKTVEELSSNTTTASLEKRAATEFQGLGFEQTKTVSLLKACAALPEDQRTVVEDLMKAHAELTAKVSKERGVFELVQSGETANGKLQKMAIEKSTTDKIPLSEAVRKISEDPAHADLVAAADKESLEFNAG